LLGLDQGVYFVFAVVFDCSLLKNLWKPGISLPTTITNPCASKTVADGDHAKYRKHKKWTHIIKLVLISSLYVCMYIFLFSYTIIILELTITRGSEGLETIFE
jgi:hypothetical protein